MKILKEFSEQRLYVNSINFEKVFGRVDRDMIQKVMGTNLKS